MKEDIYHHADSDTPHELYLQQRLMDYMIEHSVDDKVMKSLVDHYFELSAREKKLRLSEIITQTKPAYKETIQEILNYYL
ncbi:hypothetical protein IV55_GL000527 [Furfurilactobacillus siliginis]|uniref:Uncharacterized protein n=1 Tax=Furfurilactobacillus siliginis TaxID=348151 RepID=A0A0R2L6L2_9LACO|nr:hypothetical protein IV55_GL000527 [Furfurilactobacillus siliginis]